MKKLILTSVILSFCVCSAFSQVELREATRQAELFNFSEALTLYSKAWDKKETLIAAKGLATCYRQLNDYKYAESWYVKVVGLPGAEPSDFFHYAEALRNNSKYAEAKAHYLKYAELAGGDQLPNTNLLISSCDSAQVWMRQPGKLSIQPEGTINTEQGDFAAVPYQNGIVLTSDRIPKEGLPKDNRWLVFNANNNLRKNVYGWTGNSYLKLFYAEKKNGALTEPVEFAPNLNGDFHNGPATFSPDGTEIFFTRTRGITNSKKYTDDRKKQKDYTIKLELFSAVLDKTTGRWSEAKPFQYNSALDYSVGDPCLSPDGNLLYFASDMPGGQGGADLYYCERQSDGSWSSPVNLGTAVNSPGNDRAPSFDAKGDFYFSSNGRIGMGGLDIFTTKGEKTIWGMPLNMGYPVNTPQDDFSIAFNKDGKSGFLSSNRNGGKGSDDVYSFARNEIKFRLEGTVVNRKTGALLPNAVVTLYDQAKKSNVQTLTDEKENFAFPLGEESEYSLTAEKTNYVTGRKDDISTKGRDESATLYAHLDLGLDPIEINKGIKLDNIYYDLDKWNIRNDAMPDLDKLVQLMLDNPTIVVELSSHTDSRASDSYNLTLSKKRAESAVAYIISKGIAKNRIIAKGYGETRPINKCTNGVQCSEEEFQQNRRTEFAIIRY